MMNLVNTFLDYNDLSYKLKDLFIIFFYNDRAPVGKDNFDTDFLYISEMPDLYIRSCIIKALNIKFAQHRTVFSANVVEGDYLIKCKIREDSLISPRWPRAAYYFDSEAEDYIRLLLIEYISKFYDAQDHDRSQEMNNDYYIEQENFTIEDFIIDSTASSTIMRGAVINNSAVTISKTNYKFEFAGTTESSKSIDYEKCKKLFIYKHIDHLRQKNEI